LENKKNSIKKELKNTVLIYESYVKESKKMIDSKKAKTKDIKITAKIAAKAGIKKEIKKDNSDSAVAHMLIEGITISIIDIESLINKYGNETEKNILKFSKEYLEASKHQVEMYKEYL
jgi:hypothetical protein